jgi:hypothetical protein
MSDYIYLISVSYKPLEQSLELEKVTTAIKVETPRIFCSFRVTSSNTGVKESQRQQGTAPHVSEHIK